MFSERKILDCACERIYLVVADVARYPEFVPGWLNVRIVRDEGDSLVVEQQVGIGALHTWIRSRARFDPPRSILVEPLDERADGMRLAWGFVPEQAGCCKVSLRIDGRASHRLLASALDTAAEHIGHRLIDIFAARAAALHQLPCTSKAQT